MATYRKRGNGWQACIYMKGIRKSKILSSKSEAILWALEQEKEITVGKQGGIPNKTFGELLERYAEEVSPNKRSVDFERRRIQSFCKDKISYVPLCDLTAKDFSLWRDRRLKTVSASTVLRELTIMNHALNTAIKDWEWLKLNPMTGIRRPKKPPHRDRLISKEELESLLKALGYDYESAPQTISSRVGAALLFAIETAMRAGEVSMLTWPHVNMDIRTAHLPKTKNGTKRDVPLSGEAIRILEQVRNGSKSVFNLKADQIDNLFRKAKRKTAIEDLHFHDTRHVAITRLAQKINILELARMVGHKDLKMLQIYFNATAADIAQKLN